MCFEENLRGSKRIVYLKYCSAYLLKKQTLAFGVSSEEVSLTYYRFYLAADSHSKSEFRINYIIQVLLCTMQI